MNRLRSAVLGAVPNPKYFDNVIADTIDDDERADRGDFTRSGRRAGASAFGEIFEAVAGGQNLHGDPRRRRRIALADLSANRAEV